VLSPANPTSHPGLLRPGPVPTPTAGGSQVSCVVIDAAGEPTHEPPASGSANWTGGFAATRHLLELGHRRIAVIGGPARVWCSRARTDGYRAALENAEIGVNSAFIRHCDFHVESGHEQRDELLRLQNRPTEVFAESDLQTLGLYRADRELDCGSPRTCQSPVRTTCPSRGGSVPR
jgi:LacI family xylobiose transport system transcriptional regulator